MFWRRMLKFALSFRNAVNILRVATDRCRCKAFIELFCNELPLCVGSTCRCTVKSGRQHCPR